jgi:hypothetical protein
MPRSGDLPDDLKALVRRNALQLSHDRFRADSDRLASAVERALEKTAAERREREEAERIAQGREREQRERVAAEIRERQEKEQLDARRGEHEKQKRLEQQRQSQPPNPVASGTPSSRKLRSAAGKLTLLALVIGLAVVAAIYFGSPHPSPDIFPGSPVAQGSWAFIQPGHTLIPMHDGRVLDWIAADGPWRLWNYDPNNTANIFPGSPVAQGRWATIQAGHTLIPMHDGRVLDWVAADGSWRLWSYDPNNTANIFPGSPVAQGRWASIQAGHTLIPM